MLTKTEFIAACRAAGACGGWWEEVVQQYEPWPVEWTLAEQLRALRSPLKRYLYWAWYNALLPMWSIPAVDLRGVALRDAVLIRVDFTRADLREAFLPEVKMSRANLTGAKLTWADLAGADLTWADLAGANLSSANLSMALRDGVKDDPIPGWQVVNGMLYQDTD